MLRAEIAELNGSKNTGDRREYLPAPYVWHKHCLFQLSNFNSNSLPQSSLRLSHYYLPEIINFSEIKVCRFLKFRLRYKEFESEGKDS